MNTDNDDVSESWYREREARIQADRDRVGAQKITLENAYSNVEAQWRQLDQQAEEAHDSLDTRAILDIERQRARLSSEAAQLQEGYATLQQQEQQLERAGKLDYQTLVESSSDKSKLFLEVFKSKLQHDPAACRRLLHADAQIRAASNIPVDSNDYFAALEERMGFAPEERKFTFEDDYTTAKDKPNETKRSGDKSKFQATDAQTVMARNLPGISEDEYLKACAQPFSQASQTVSLEPNELDFGQSNKGMEVNFDETPKQAPVKYKQPNPKTSVNLSPAELSLIENMAVTTGKPLAEMRKEFAAQKLALHSGKTSHMLYQDRLKAMGQA